MSYNKLGESQITLRDVAECSLQLQQRIGIPHARELVQALDRAVRPDLTSTTRGRSLHLIDEHLIAIASAIDRREPGEVSREARKEVEDSIQNGLLTIERLKHCVMVLGDLPFLTTLALVCAMILIPEQTFDGPDYARIDIGVLAKAILDVLRSAKLCKPLAKTQAEGVELVEKSLVLVSHFEEILPVKLAQGTMEMNRLQDGWHSELKKEHTISKPSRSCGFFGKYDDTWVTTFMDLTNDKQCYLLKSLSVAYRLNRSLCVNSQDRDKKYEYCCYEEEDEDGSKQIWTRPHALQGYLADQFVCLAPVAKDIRRLLPGNTDTRTAIRRLVTDVWKALLIIHNAGEDFMAVHKLAWRSKSSGSAGLAGHA